MSNVRHIAFLTFEASPLVTDGLFPPTCHVTWCREQASFTETVWHAVEGMDGWGTRLYGNVACDTHRFFVAETVAAIREADGVVETPINMPVTLVELGNFNWTNDFSYHRTLTCINHQEMRWSTKNPFQRSIFYISQEECGAECNCPLADMRVIVEESQAPIREEIATFERCNTHGYAHECVADAAEDFGNNGDSRPAFDDYDSDEMAARHPLI